MQLLNENQNEFELKIDSLEDLWVLSEFIVSGDIIYSTTTRKVKIGSDKTKQVTKIIFVELLVKKTNFVENILRISGEIQNETEFTAVGQSQTLNFSVNDKIKIKKKELLNFEKKLLKKALESKSSNSLLILIDKDELLLSEFNNFNYRIVFHETGLGNKKYIKTDINENEEKFNLISSFLKKDYSNIIISGPGIYKSNFQKYLKSKLNIKTILFQSPEVSANYVPKLIDKIAESGLLEENQLAKERELIDLLLKDISLNSKFTYGEENCFLAINEGKVDNLLVTTKYIEKKKENDEYLDFSNYVKILENLNGNLNIINSKNETGRILDGLGGIATINRY